MAEEIETPAELEPSKCPKTIIPAHELICHLAALGWKKKDIAEKVGYSASRVSTLLKTEEFKFIVKKNQYLLFGKDPKKRFSSLVPKAIDAVQDIMESDSAPQNTKLAAAKEILDRSMGRAHQTMDVGGNMLLDIYKKLDRIEDGSKIKALDVESKEIDEEIEEAVIVSPEDDEDEEQEVQLTDDFDPDSWIQENL